MPRKYIRKPKRRFRRAIRRKGKGKHIYAGRETVSYMTKTMPISPKYRCKMSCDWLAFCAAGAVPPTVSQNAFVGLNYAYHPVANGSWAPITGYGPFTVSSSIGSSSIMPVGFSQLCPSNGQFYRRYRVYSSKLSIAATPTDIRDSFQMSLTPSVNTTIPAELAVAMAQPYTATKTFYAGKAQGTKDDMLTNYISVHKLAGVTQSAIQNDLSGSFIGDYLGNLPIKSYDWVINISTLNGALNTAPILFRFKLDYWIEFFDASAGALFVT